MTFADDTLICGNCSSAFTDVTVFLAHKNAQIRDGNHVVCVADDNTVANFANVVFVVEGEGQSVPGVVPTGEGTQNVAATASAITAGPVRKRGRPRKVVDEAESAELPPPVDKPLHVDDPSPIEGNNGQLTCRKCKRVFYRLRHFTSHKCLHDDYYVEYSVKKEPSYIESQEVQEESQDYQIKDEAGDSDFALPQHYVNIENRGHGGTSGIEDVNSDLTDIPEGDLKCLVSNVSGVGTGISTATGTLGSNVNSVKRKRGRPRKHPIVIKQKTVSQDAQDAVKNGCVTGGIVNDTSLDQQSDVTQGNEAVKKKRGRPTKLAQSLAEDKNMVPCDQYSKDGENTTQNPVDDDKITRDPAESLHDIIDNVPLIKKGEVIQKEIAKGKIHVTYDMGDTPCVKRGPRKRIKTEDILGIFNSEEDKKAFKEALSVDLSHVDHLYNVHMLEQEVNHQVTGARPMNHSLYLYSCKTCDKVFKTLSLTRLHVLIHTDLRPFKCPRCSFSSNCKGNLYTHVRCHTGQFFHCQKCPFKSVNRGHVIEHELTHLGTKIQCTMCQRFFNTRKSLVNHIRMTHRSTPEGKEYLLSFLAGRQEKGTAIIHQCHVCNRKFKKRVDRDRHLFTHDVADTPCLQKCDVCSYTSIRKLYMEKHFLKHSIIYRCSKCSQPFVSSIHLINHFITSHPDDQWDTLLSQSINCSLYLPQFHPDYDNPDQDPQNADQDPGNPDQDPENPDQDHVSQNPAVVTQLLPTDNPLANMKTLANMANIGNMKTSFVDSDTMNLNFVPHLANMTANIANLMPNIANLMQNVPNLTPNIANLTPNVANMTNMTPIVPNLASNLGNLNVIVSNSLNPNVLSKNTALDSMVSRTVTSNSVSRGTNVVCRGVDEMKDLVEKCLMDIDSDVIEGTVDLGDSGRVRDSGSMGDTVEDRDSGNFSGHIAEMRSENTKDGTSKNDAIEQSESTASNSGNLVGNLVEQSEISGGVGTEGKNERGEMDLLKKAVIESEVMEGIEGEAIEVTQQQNGSFDTNNGRFKSGAANIGVHNEVQSDYNSGQNSQTSETDKLVENESITSEVANTNKEANMDIDKIGLKGNCQITNDVTECNIRIDDMEENPAKTQPILDKTTNKIPENEMESNPNPNEITDPNTNNITDKTQETETESTPNANEITEKTQQTETESNPSSNEITDKTQQIETESTPNLNEITETFGYSVLITEDYVPFFKHQPESIMQPTNLVKKFGYRRLTGEIFRDIREAYGTEECEHCGRLFHYQREVDNHVLTHTGARPFSCTQCSFRCNTKGNLKHHTESTHSDVQFRCTQCEFVASNRLKLWTHQQKHWPGGKRFSCTLCLVKLHSREEATEHIKSSHPEVMEDKIDGLIKFGPKVRSKAGKASCKCPYCGRVFKSSHTELQKHIWIHEGVKPFKCQLCSYSGRSKQNLKAHMLRHSSDKPFKCTVCDKAFKSRTALRWHIRAHIHGELKCDQCPYTATQIYHLQRHQQTHYIKKRYLCQFCNFSANTITYIKLHYTQKHPGTTFEDTGAPSELTTESDKPCYKCMTCDYLFGNLTDLKRHMKNKHNMDSDTLAENINWAELPVGDGVVSAAPAMEGEVGMDGTQIVATDTLGAEQLVMLADTAEPTSEQVGNVQMIEPTTAEIEPSTQEAIQAITQALHENFGEAITAENGEMIFVEQNEVVISTEEHDGNTEYVIHYILPGAAHGGLVGVGESGMVGEGEGGMVVGEGGMVVGQAIVGENGMVVGDGIVGETGIVVGDSGIVGEGGVVQLVVEGGSGT